MNRQSAIIVVCLIAAGCSERPQNQQDLPKREIEATVTSISPANDRRHLPNVYVTFKTDDGRQGLQLVHPARLKCRVGDRVQALAQGISITIANDVCERGTLR